MKRQKFMFAKKIILMLIVAGIIVLPGTILGGEGKKSQQLEGSWTVTITPVVPPGVPPLPPFRAYATIARGGAFIGSDARRPSSKQHGTWEHVRGNEFAWTFIEEVFDDNGESIGTIKVRVRLNVTSEDEFVGVSNGEQRDSNGNLVFNRCATIRGERITIEPLAPQCQSILPPDSEQ